MKVVLLTLLLLVITTLAFSGCGYKVVTLDKKFDGFLIYDKPNKVDIEVNKDCDINGKIEDCVSVKHLKPLLIRVKKLERIVDNYSQDIRDYRELK